MYSQQPPGIRTKKRTSSTQSHFVRSDQLGLTIYIANSFIKRLKGLLGREPLQSKQGLLIKPCNSVHTAFMRYSIDVIFMDKFGLITCIESNLKPWRMAGGPGWFKHDHMVLELTSGTAQILGLKVGMILRINYNHLI